MRIAVFCDVFPELSETFVVNEIRALRRAGHQVRIVALARAERPYWPDELDAPVTFLCDLARPEKLRATARLALRMPLAAVRDYADRAAWHPDEQPRRLAALAPVAVELDDWDVEHIHVHFASHAAMEGLRVGALLGVPVSITAHAYEIFSTPRNLELKLVRAAFTTSGCRYNVEHLRSVAGPADADRVHEVVMGVDSAVFQRGTPYPEARRVLAVGRLVEKKGFDVLIEAAAHVPSLERLTIVGDGPLRGELTALISRLGLGERVELVGARTPGEVREALEHTAVLAMPSVIAADGDRDSMPVAVKEAMAMEVPVVATDAVGLPELVDDEVGRLVPPRDSAALAAALEELLAMTAAERAALGARGRARVRARCDVDRETQRLIEHIEAAI
jgi:colanic acid/amylovoran biosynthesis glycosyltransferase